MALMDIAWVISLLLLLCLTILALLTLISQKNHASSQSANKLPPGPPKLPIIGNLHQLVGKNSLPHHRLAELAGVYGPIMHLHLGEVPTVVVSSAEVARDVMRTHDAAFCNRPSILLAEHVFYGRTDIALAPYGEYWRQVRKIAMLELFTAKRVQSFRPIREEEVANLVKSMAMEQGSVVNLSKKLFALTFDITSRLAFKKKGTEQEEFKALVDDITKIASGFSIFDLYPSIRCLCSITGMRRKLQDLVRRSNMIVDSIIYDHISKKRQGKKEDHEDLVDVLLAFHKDKDEVSHGSQFSLAIDNIKAIFLQVLGAGSETSSTIMEWTMSELLKNPKIMEKTQNEVRGILQFYEKHVVDEASIKELKYLKQVIKETLRLHPPLPLLVPRESMEQCEICGYKIPTKTRVIVNAWAISKDPKRWLEPERFIPERFEDTLVDYNGTHFELIPFGAGRRICPGIGLALANVELALATLLYHFNWKLPNGCKPQDLNMDETFGITARRRHELLVIPCVYPQSKFN
ncbi:hypothetical protein Cgig2_011775 [Carnegiea gigantea]|uniref:Cytochrome P450 n=1 Tax=Carnegiea gigantea TaxID=171969 RepID=A0A9Q1GX90_9CARY|nr:hypothetical protein Cgig2_011775 [Carnegiea gigantea]